MPSAHERTQSMHKKIQETIQKKSIQYIKKRNDHSSVIAEKIHTRNTAREIKKRMHCQERKKSKINELKKQQKTFETN